MSGATIVVRANFDRKVAGRGEAKDFVALRRSYDVLRGVLEQAAEKR